MRGKGFLWGGGAGKPAYPMFTKFTFYLCNLTGHLEFCFHLIYVSLHIPVWFEKMCSKISTKKIELTKYTLVCIVSLYLNQIKKLKIRLFMTDFYAVNIVSIAH